MSAGRSSSLLSARNGGECAAGKAAYGSYTLPVREIRASFRIRGKDDYVPDEAAISCLVRGHRPQVRLSEALSTYSHRPAFWPFLWL